MSKGGNSNDNHANQCNPNNDAYWQSRGYDERPENGDNGSNIETRIDDDDDEDISNNPSIPRDLNTEDINEPTVKKEENTIEKKKFEPCEIESIMNVDCDSFIPEETTTLFPYIVGPYGIDYDHYLKFKSIKHCVRKFSCKNFDNYVCLERLKKKVDDKI